MTRTASIILTPAERKAQVAQLKEGIKAIAAESKALIADQKASIKTHTATVKVLETQIKSECKQREAEDKAVAKELAMIEKKKALLEAQLSALTNDPAFVPVKKVKDAVVTSKGEQVVVVVKDEITDKPKRTRRTKAEMEAFRAGAAA